MYESKLVTLGSFEVMSNKIYISDPYYEYDEHENTCVLTLKDVINGKYIATTKVARIYHDIKSLTIKHEDYLHSEPSIFAGKIGVDSGQAGFFDKEYYAENQGGDFDDLTTLYGLACSLILSKQKGGIVHNRRKFCPLKAFGNFSDEMKSPLNLFFSCHCSGVENLPSRLIYSTCWTAEIFVPLGFLSDLIRK